MNEEKSNKVYSCKYCQQTFNKVGLLANHIRHNHTTVDKVECEFCHKKFTHSGLKYHIEHCRQNPSRIETDLQKNSRLKKENRLTTEHLPGTCCFCGKQCHNQNSLRQHEIRCKHNPNRTVPGFTKYALQCAHKNTRGKPSHNKGMSFEHRVALGISTVEEVEELRSKIREGVNKARLEGKCTGRANSEEREMIRRQKISEYAKLSHLGGYHKGSGRGKKGWYKGIFCDSSWELAYVIYCLENNKSIKRCEERRTYIFEGVEKIYIPDFVVDGQVVEIKGYMTKQWECKHLANPDIVVIDKDEIQPILDFVVSKYGKDFISLYERRSG